MVDVNKLKKPGKGTPPTAAVATLNNLSKPASGQKVPLQVKIAAELRREVRAYAAEHDMEISALFEEMWQHYRQARG